jgi:hypothetical protein
VTVETGKILWYSSLSQTIWKRIDQRKPEIIAKDVALNGLNKIKDVLFKARL